MDDHATLTRQMPQALTHLADEPELAGRLGSAGGGSSGGGGEDQTLIDMLRVRKITTVTTDVDEELLPQVDAAAAAQAAPRGLRDFHWWLTRHSAQVDFDAYTRLCTSRPADRCVRFTHGIDGMSHLDARLPTTTALVPSATPVEAKITSMIPQATLTDDSEAPAMAADRS